MAVKSNFMFAITLPKFKFLSNICICSATKDVELQFLTDLNREYSTLDLTNCFLYHMYMYKLFFYHIHMTCCS